MKRLLLIVAACFFGFSAANAQLVQVVHEQVMDEATYLTLPNAVPGNYPAGGVTYRIYAELTDPVDFVTSVFAIDGCYNVEIGANNTFFNTGLGGLTGPDLNAGFFGFFPEIQYDSMVTIGRASNADAGDPISTVASNPSGYWSDPTNAVAGVPTGNDMNLQDGAWFITNNPGAVNGLPSGPSNRVLLGQFTITDIAAWNYKLNVQIIDDQIPGNNLLFVHTLSGNLICSSGDPEFFGGDIGLIYPYVPGCTDAGALNYDPAATADDGSCIVPACAGVAETQCYGDNNDAYLIVADGADPIIAEITFSDVETCCDLLNVYDGSDNTGAVLLSGGIGDLAGTILVATSGNMYFEYITDSSWSCSGNGNQSATELNLYCGTTAVPGCTNSGALNYDPAATVDDGSCITPACAPVADSYCYVNDGDSFVIDADGADPIVLEILSGSTEAGWDDLTIYDGTDNTGAVLYGPADGDHSGVIVVATSGNMFVEFNSDSSGSCDSGLEAALTFNIYCGTRNLDVPGCTNAAACNFDPAATVDDGSCVLPVANDDCANATGVALDGLPVVVDNSCATPDGAALDCDFPSSIIGDVWFSFVAPAVGPGSGVITIETSDDGLGSNLDDTQLGVYDACGGTQLYCNDDGGAGLYSLITINVCDLVAGNTYFVQVDGFGASDTGTANLTLTLSDLDGCTDPTADNYDACATNDDGSCVFGIPGCTDAGALNYDPAATVDDGSCIVPLCAAVPGTYCYETNGIFGFLITADSFNPIVLEILAGTIEVSWDTITIYDGSDNTGTVLYGPADGDQTGVIVEATSGSMYVEIDSDSVNSCASGDQTALSYNVYCGTVSIPGCTDPTACNYDPAATTDDGSCLPTVANDLCANATPMTTDGSLFGIDNSCALADGATPDCWFGDPVSADVWYSFVAPASGSVIIETFSDGSFTLTDTQIAVYDGCGGTEIACDDDGSTGLYSLIELSACDLMAGATYLIQVNGYNGDSGTADISVSLGDVSGCTDPLSLNYDPCATIDDGSCIAGIAGALAITPELFPNCTGVLGTTVLPGETSLPEQGPFSGNPDDEAWYSFNAPCNGAVKVLIDDFADDMVVELYDGSLNFLAAGDDNGAVFGEYAFYDGVAAGDLLYARVYTYGTGTTADFNICISSYCASSPDAPYPSLVHDLCSTYKTDFIPGADNYDWTLVSQLDGDVSTYSSMGNNTFVQVADFAPTLEYGETYDVTIDVNFTDADMGAVTVAGQVTDVLVMDAGPTTELSPSYVGQSYNLNDWIRCKNVCAVDEYVWRITPDGGSPLPDHTVPGSFAPIALLADFVGIAPGTNYTAEIAIVLNGTQYPFGPAQPFSTNASPLLEVRSDAWCSNGPIGYGNYLVTNASASGAVDFTWEFTNTNGVDPTFYWKKGDGVRILQAGSVSFGGSNLLVEGETYSVRVKPEYGNFISGDNSDPSTEPTYDVVTAYGAAQEICIVGLAPAAQQGANALRDGSVAIESAIYPNPTNGDFVNLNLNNISEDEDKVSVDIYDLFGKLVQSEQIATTGSSNLNVVIQLNSELASGMYMVNITVGDVITTERLVIEK